MAGTLLQNSIKHKGMFGIENCVASQPIIPAMYSFNGDIKHGKTWHGLLMDILFMSLVLYGWCVVGYGAASVWEEFGGGANECTRILLLLNRFFRSLS